MVAVTRTTATIEVRRGSVLPFVRQLTQRRVRVQTSRTVFTGTQSSYEHTQSVAATQWTVNHQLGRRPAAVSVLSPGGVEVDAAVTHVTINQLVVEFAAPYSGSVRAA